MRAQRGPGLGAAFQSQLEARVMAQSGGVIAILISGGNHHHPETDDLLQAMPYLDRVAQVREAGCQQTGQPLPTLNLSQERQPGIGAHICTIKIKQDWFAIHG